MIEAPHIPVSWGEAIDRLTILEIKAARLTDQAALVNVKAELSLLRESCALVLGLYPDVVALAAHLKGVNEKLWQIEDDIRAKEAAKSFDAEFIALARSVYKTNDERGRLKRQINILLSSSLSEEKSYQPY
jgi:hypothetical protein